MGKNRNAADTGSMIQVFKSVTDNPLIRRVLRAISTYCNKDHANRLEVALELYTGVRKKACAMCTLAKQILSPILKVSGNAFGVTPDQLKERFSDPYWRKGLASVIKGIALFGVQTPFTPGAPFQVVWNVTRACNLKCKHCYENAGRKDPDELNTEEALRVIDILANAGVLILAFSGGEPTIRPDILKLIRHASRRGMYIACATNAILFSDREIVKKFKKAGLQFVQISLDGLNPKTHDEFRGVPGAFEKTVQGIKNCVAEGLFVEIATTVTKYNYKEIPDLIEYADKLGVDWIMLYNFVPTGRGVDILDQDLEPEEREELLKILWDYMRHKKVKTECLSTAPQFARVALEEEMKEREAPLEQCDGVVVPTHFYNPSFSGKLKNLADFIGGCGAGRFYMAIEPNGDLYPCVFFPHEKAVKVGNILTDDFEELWRSHRVLLTCRNKDLLQGNCGVCEFKYNCGGCRARAYNYFKNLRAPDPGCVHNKKYWEALKISLKENYVKETVGHDILLRKLEKQEVV
ncbi:MAG: radical SAM protein [Candidatus Odinarchaeia archaeon]